MALFWDDESRSRKPISKLIKDGLYRNQKGKCMYCGRKLEIADMHADHKTPFIRNGSDSEKNLQMLCGPCNTRKGDMTDGEFRKAYKAVGLLSVRDAGGRPPSKIIPLKNFEALTKELRAKRAKLKSKRDDGWW